jgi:nitroreductase
VVHEPYTDPQRAAIAKVLRERRTVHEFTADPVPDALIEAALDSARWAPNHHRTEPWRVYLLGPRAQSAITELNTALVAASRGERAAAVKRERWLAMPGWLVMTAPLNIEDAEREREDYAACCCAAQNMMLALWAVGVGVKWTTGDVVRTPEFAAVVGFDLAVERVVGLFWYGWPATITVQHRRPLQSFVTRVA